MTLNDIVLLIITTLSSAFVLYLASKMPNNIRGRIYSDDE